MILFLFGFVWGAIVYIWFYDPPPGELQIYVVGKQWMWKMEHPGGQREIDALHVPVNTTVRLVLASQDVVQSFFIPAFRIKHDVVPGTLETVWFKATKTGTYKIECTQLCGVQHANMTGEVTVLEPAAYARWLKEQGIHPSLAQEGEALFREYGCSGRHSVNSTVYAPLLNGIYGSLVHLQDGSARVADERYLRDCILLPRTFTVRRLSAGDARLLGPAQRGRSREADRLHQIPRQIGNRAMATITADVATDYLTAENTVRSWLLTKDHKRIGLLFFASITFFFFIGGIATTLIRLHLATPSGLLQPSRSPRALR